MGADLQLTATDDAAWMDVTLRFSVYYRIFPSYAQQQQHQAPRRQIGADDAGDADGAVERDAEAGVQALLPGFAAPAGPQPPAARAGGADSLALRFRRVDASASAPVGMHSEADPEWALDTTVLQQAVDAELTRCLQVVMADADRYRAQVEESENTRVPDTALASSDTFQAFLDALRVEVAPDWNIEIACACRRVPITETARVFTLDLTNASGPIDNSNIECFVFNAQIELRPSGWTPSPFLIDLAPKGFRYSREMWGQGFNCALERIDAFTFRTAHTPIYRQMRYVTQNEPPARFQDLAKDPIPVLRQVEQAMRDYRQRWLTARREYESESANWVEVHGAEFDHDLAMFEREIDRFGRGVALLESDADCKDAFCLMNQTFHRLGNTALAATRKDQWRLFQIVFIVSQIPGLFGHKIPSNERDEELATVDVIYFPTGGGKTEAYLGTVAFCCFFDRLRGKTAGVTCWTRFPLRLLTLQQTQRMADVIGIAELVRAGHTDARLSGRTIDPFAVGYFVGEEGTPNKLVPPGRNPNYGKAEDAVNWSQAIDPVVRQKWKRVVTCPSCRTDTVSVDFDVSLVRLVHRCTNTACKFPHGVLPVHVVDNEIYRYLPSVIVGTVDKLASVGNQRKFSLLLGAVQGRCTVHGYYWGACTQEGCKDTKLLRPGLPPGISGPAIFVQDELHLLKEGLGTFDSHYETFIQRLARELGNERPIKIIASSATIEQFERQVEHLYGKNRTQARIFPGLGPRLSESFYAKTLTYPQRIFVGLLPHNKTIFNSILELIEYYHTEAMCLRRGGNQGAALCAEPGAAALPPPALSDLYQTSMTYFLANRQLASIRTDLESDTNPRLQAEGFTALQLRELTGSTSTDEVTRILRRLETSLSNDDAPDAVLATSMVSHGVDIDRLNAMIFYGMPRVTAEYIQSSSRVGRSHVGIVFLCFHSARERDQSHFQYFQKYHEYLGQLVEPVAINRWATYSVDKTLPGLFMAVLLQILVRRLGFRSPGLVYMRDAVQKKISTGAITAADFEQILRDSYIRIGGGDAASRAPFDRQISLRVRQFLDQILQPGGTDVFVSNALFPRPMMSLRDVEEAVPIELDSEGSDWSATRV
jgi:hypothetical protein